MNLNLASMYGTPGADVVAAEEQEKVAQTELFCKLAAENGIDLNQFNDDQVQELWNSTFSKTAEEEKKHEKSESKEEEEAEEKKAAAYAEFEATKVAQAKLAEADYLGRLMAHAYVQELGQIGQSMEKDAGRATDAAMHIPLAVEKLEAAGKRGLEYLKSKGTAAYEGAKTHGKAGLEHVKAAPGKFPGAQDLKKGTSHARSAWEAPSGSVGRTHHAGEAAKALGKGVGKGGATLAAGAGAVYAGHKAHEKYSSALDEQAAGLALEKAAEAGWDVDEAAGRLNAVLTLGAPESEKIAAANSFGEALELRSLEMLEAVGYPISWEG